MEQYSKLFQKSYLGDTNTDTQLNKFLEKHPNYVVDKVSFENPEGTCIENLFVVFKEKECLVRCRDCDLKHYSENGNLWCDIFDKIMPENGFCCFADDNK